MKAVLDACVLYPTVMREILIGVAKEGVFAPVWSDRILEEWARAAAKLGPDQDLFARGEISVLKSKFNDALTKTDPDLEGSLHLPDPNDRHVLAAAIAAGAPTIITLNIRDFPRRNLEEFTIRAVHPDAFLHEAWGDHAPEITDVTRRVHKTACAMSGEDLDLRKLMKKARLPRLGKKLA